MTEAQTILSELPEMAPESVDAAVIQEVQQWLRDNAIAAVGANGCAPDRALQIGPNPTKGVQGEPLNDDDRTQSMDILAEDQPDQLFCTHGVVLPTAEVQDFGEVQEYEAIVVRKGILSCTINGHLIGNFFPGQVLFVDKGQHLAVQAQGNAPVDYSCFYGFEGIRHVEQCKNVAKPDITLTWPKQKHSLTFAKSEAGWSCTLEVRKPKENQTITVKNMQEAALPDDIKPSDLLASWLDAGGQKGDWRFDEVPDKVDGAYFHHVRYFALPSGKFLIWVVDHVDDVPHDDCYVADSVPTLEQAFCGRNEQ